MVTSWTTQARESEPISFYDSIKPILAVHCYKCHAAEKAKGGLRLDLRATALAGGESGRAALVPGYSRQSHLWQRLVATDPDQVMPPKGPRVSVEEIKQITQWIDQGAPWPDRDDYWAFQKPQIILVPPGLQPHPIDRFVETKLAAAQIAPSPTADKRTLVRRAFFDLLGIPPTPEEAARFVEDSAPNAYLRLLDRLLADPRYGERWARFWLDLVRYGESDGYEDDKVRRTAWRYRDYVIAAFNSDKPFNRFAQEQIAGDELWPDSSEAWTATAFARLGPWDGMSKEPDKQRHDFLSDATDAFGSVFLGLTLGCARCHDHKYDVITQKDYYRVQAFFGGLKRESHHLANPLDEPVFVSAAYQRDAAELASLSGERELLLHAARDEFASSAAGEAKIKISDEAIKKRLESSHPGRLAGLDGKIQSLKRSMRFYAPNAEVTSGGPQPKTYVLKGGEIALRGDEVTPGFILALLSPENREDSAQAGQLGRADLARWVTASSNPLFARVAVNRIWQRHFGRGLVATPSDFGRNGQRPTHPELLDWLAGRFIADGYSVKSMHQLIMSSDAYRRSSGPNTPSLTKDPENKLLWRWTRQRLEGEAVRDSLLSIAGTLNPMMGGPGVYAKLPAGINVEFPNNDKELSWGTSTPAQDRRRSIYLFQRRTLTFPLMEVFDAAPMNQSCAVRPQTTVAPQALALLNGEFARERAAEFARRLLRLAGADQIKQIEQAFAIAFSRAPSEVERQAAITLLHEQQQWHASAVRPAHAALVDFCHMILNANELIYVD